MKDVIEQKLLEEIYPVSRETRERLTYYVNRLVTWQKKTNLIAPSTLNEIWTRHIADSLQCVAIKPDCRRWLDLGSGGGFPGLVIAAVMADFDDAAITLVESNHKKTAFLRQVNRHMGARAKVITARIEDVNRGEFSADVVTARALTSLADLLDLASPWLLNGAVGLFHKGRDFSRELSECDGKWSFDLIHHDSRINDESVVLEISNLQRV